eukprot:EG_transcript_23160
MQPSSSHQIDLNQRALALWLGSPQFPAIISTASPFLPSFPLPLTSSLRSGCCVITALTCLLGVRAASKTPSHAAGRTTFLFRPRRPEVSAVHSPSCLLSAGLYLFLACTPVQPPKNQFDCCDDQRCCTTSMTGQTCVCAPLQPLLPPKPNLRLRIIPGQDAVHTTAPAGV